MAVTAGYKSAVYVTSQPSVVMTNEAMTDSGDHTTYTVTNAAHRYWDKTVAFVVQMQQDEYQQVAITGSPSGGTFTLTFGAQTTAAINWNDNAATVQARLQALSSIGASNCTVTGGPGPGTPFVVEFTNAKGLAAQALITLQTNSLTGGSSPSVAITRVAGGQAWGTVSSGFTIQYVGGKVIWTVAQQASTQTRISSGNYFAYSQLGDGHQWEIAVDATLVDTTTFGSSWHTQVPITKGSNAKFAKFYNDNAFLTLMTNLMVVVLFIDGSSAPAGPRYEAFAYIKQDQIKNDVKAVIMEDVSFEIDGQVYYLAS